MISNLSPFEMNALHGLAGAGIGRDGECLAFECPEILEEMEQIFLRWKDRDAVLAEKCALEWALVGPFLELLLPAAANAYKNNPNAALTPEQTCAAIREFCKQRLIRRYFPNHSTDRMHRQIAIARGNEEGIGGP